MCRFEIIVKDRHSVPRYSATLFSSHERFRVIQYFDLPELSFYRHVLRRKTVELCRGLTESHNMRLHLIESINWIELHKGRAETTRVSVLEVAS